VHGPFGEIATIAVAILLASVAVLVMLKVQEDEKRRLEQKLEGLSEHSDAIARAVLDVRILLETQVDPIELQKWKDGVKALWIGDEIERRHPGYHGSHSIQKLIDHLSARYDNEVAQVQERRRDALREARPVGEDGVPRLWWTSDD
jgi:hypothetical protein